MKKEYIYIHGRKVQRKKLPKSKVKFNKKKFIESVVNLPVIG